MPAWNKEIIEDEIIVYILLPNTKRKVPVGCMTLLDKRIKNTAIKFKIEDSRCFHIASLMNWE